MVGPTRPQFVIFGSSIVQFSFGNGGWSAILADLYARKADVLVRGYAGWNSRRALLVLDQVFPKDATIQPSLVIVYFGGNDSVDPHPSGLGAHVPLPEYKENMRKIGKHLKSLSEKTRVIFLTAPPVNEEQIHEASDYVPPQNRTNESCKAYSDACLDVCRELDIKGVDLWTSIQKRKDWSTTCFTDGVHFSSEGSKIVGEEILKVLREADWEPRLHWKSLPTEFSEDSPYDPPAADGKTTINIAEISVNEGADVLLRGYAGWNSRRALQVLEQVFPKNATTQPSLVIVYFGGNDSMHPHPSGLGAHVPLNEYVENMRKTAKHLKSLSEKTRVIFLTAPPVNEEQIRENLSDQTSPQKRTNESCKIYSDACLEVCREFDVKGVDLWTSIQKIKDWSTTCFRDGIHFSSEGSKIVAEEILKVLREADWEPCLHWKSLPTEFSEDSPYDPPSADGTTTVNIAEQSAAASPMKWGLSNEI
ncbi:GDSL esterase/lipase CPRD49-like [Pyrus ussuriensis x Pyrus communis]|uniref:GDSL esterase/lipase CPRD49-like n=1 Tax=Pyrus ussuriensis x Pyrus communis TaxID=2448454 RepID=A0A5N5H226_9ROSA|nr:GDSL esterase/lipase CPRD49-like [Pyrus ussuriensis x Pyrus communis]